MDIDKEFGERFARTILLAADFGTTGIIRTWLMTKKDLTH